MLLLGQRQGLPVLVVQFPLARVVATDTWSSCSYTYEVREMDGTTVIATDKTPKKARNANTAYRVAAGGTLGLWDCVNDELLIAYDETELTRTDCSA